VLSVHVALLVNWASELANTKQSPSHPTQIDSNFLPYNPFDLEICYSLKLEMSKVHIMWTKVSLNNSNIRKPLLQLCFNTLIFSYWSRITVMTLSFWVVGGPVTVPKWFFYRTFSAKNISNRSPSTISIHLSVQIYQSCRSIWSLNTILLFTVPRLTSWEWTSSYEICGILYRYCIKCRCVTCQHL
jgi:hypothetical protein